MILYPEANREADMGYYYALDLRRRVVDAIEDGMSARGAAARFSVAPSTAIRWHRCWRETGGLKPAPQGQPPRSKLDEHADFILELLETEKDIALHEVAERLGAERDLRTCPATVWYFLSKRGITHKKRRRTRLSSSEPTSLRGAKLGSKARSSSTPSG